MEMILNVFHLTLFEGMISFRIEIFARNVVLFSNIEKNIFALCRQNFYFLGTQHFFPLKIEWEPSPFLWNTVFECKNAPCENSYSCTKCKNHIIIFHFINTNDSFALDAINHSNKNRTVKFGFSKELVYFHSNITRKT